MVERYLGGLLLTAIGLAMVAGLFPIALIPANDVFTVISLFIVVEGWTIVATLLFTLGLQRILGPDSRFERYLARSWRRVFVFVAGSSLIVAFCWLLAVF